jgi:hypothetical protein
MQPRFVASDHWFGLPGITFTEQVHRAHSFTVVLPSSCGPSKLSSSSATADLH